MKKKGINSTSKICFDSFDFRCVDMSQRIKKHCTEIGYLAKCCPKNRKFIIRGCKQELIKAIGDISLTLIKNKIPLQPKDKRTIKKYIKTLQSLATSSIPIGKKSLFYHLKKGVQY